MVEKRIRARFLASLGMTGRILGLMAESWRLTSLLRREKTPDLRNHR
jgi:hypothetical protein